MSHSQADVKYFWQKPVEVSLMEAARKFKATDGALWPVAA
jgi:hypothetical protein